MLKVDIKPMKNLTKETRQVICKCPEPCKKYIHLEDYGRFCEGSALNFAYMLISLLKGGKRMAVSNERQEEWTISEVLFLKNWYDKGMRYGDRKLIAEVLNRTERSVSSKLDHMKRMKMI